MRDYVPTNAASSGVRLDKKDRQRSDLQGLYLSLFVLILTGAVVLPQEIRLVYWDDRPGLQHDMKPRMGPPFVAQLSIWMVQSHTHTVATAAIKMARG